MIASVSLAISACTSMTVSGGNAVHLPSTPPEARHFVYRNPRIRESQDDFNGNYFVGYDRDRSQFLMIDADDPASEAYFTEGWHGKTLLLTSVNDKSQSALPHRIQYDVDDSHRFTVTWELLEGTAWKAEPSVKCIKVDRRRSIAPPKK
jgi:hypothetical protein